MTAMLGASRDRLISFESPVRKKDITKFFNM